MQAALLAATLAIYHPNGEELMQGSIESLEPQAVVFDALTYDRDVGDRIFPGDFDHAFVPWSITIHYHGDTIDASDACWAIGGNGGLSLTCAGALK